MSGCEPEVLVSKLITFSLLSSQYMLQARASCFSLLKQEAINAFCLALARAGSSIAARMAMIATTTSNSMRVNPWWADLALGLRIQLFSPGIFFIIRLSVWRRVLACNLCCKHGAVIELLRNSIEIFRQRVSNVRSI